MENQNVQNNDGLIDFVRQLLLHNDSYDKAVLNMMLLPFWIMCIYIYAILCSMFVF